MIILFDTKTNLLSIEEPHNVLDKLYYDEAHVPTKTQIEKLLAKSDIKIKEFFKKKNNISKSIKIIRKNISKLDYKIPLYDIFSENIYLIGRDNIYNRVMHQHYRFPTKDLFNYFVNKYNKYDQNNKNNNKLDPIEQRKYRKLKLMIKFLKSFDIDELYKTYMTSFYLYSDPVGKNISICKRPSFLPHFQHLRPYYSQNDIHNIGLNLGLSLTTINEMSSIELCNYVTNNDISSNLLLQHQKYMIQQDRVGLIQYYTLQGSFFMNQYLRNMTSYDCKNIYLESLITPMWELIANSPEFDKEYILYRFIHDDVHIRDLHIGDIYCDTSFISTTRDPFYRSDLYKFGFILIKIKIPKNIRGIALCVETLSHFPEEQEIIFPPLTLLKLDKKDNQCEYYHTDKEFGSQIKTRYEFTYVGKDEIKYPEKQLCDKYDNLINFLKLDKIETITLEEKIRYFSSKYVNNLFQYNAQIGTNIFTIITERYDSTGAYKKFYAVTTQNGFLMYTLHNNYILFMIEIGEMPNSNLRYIHVNYYVRYSTIDKTKLYDDDDFVTFISSIAHYFGIDKIILWADFKSCDIFIDKNINNVDNIEDDKLENLENIDNKEIKKQRGFINKNKHVNYKNNNTNIAYNYYGGTYCIDFYEYLKNNIRKYRNISSMELQPKFSFFQLDKLKLSNPLIILDKSDLDEIYQIYDKIYLPSNNNQNNIAKFYIWMIENKCYLIDILIEKMHKLFRVNNPFETFYYVLDPIGYLYNRHLIDSYPTFTFHAINVHNGNNHIIPKNNYRINA
jgi:hypothetical protein